MIRCVNIGAAQCVSGPRVWLLSLYHYGYVMCVHIKNTNTKITHIEKAGFVKQDFKKRSNLGSGRATRDIKQI